MYVLRSSEHESFSLINNILKIVFAAMSRYVLNKQNFYALRTNTGLKFFSIIENTGKISSIYKGSKLVSQL